MLPVMVTVPSTSAMNWTSLGVVIQIPTCANVVNQLAAVDAVSFRHGVIRAVEAVGQILAGRGDELARACKPY